MSEPPRLIINAPRRYPTRSDHATGAAVDITVHAARMSDALLALARAASGAARIMHVTLAPMIETTWVEPPTRVQRRADRRRVTAQLRRDQRTYARHAHERRRVLIVRQWVMHHPGRVVLTPSYVQHMTQPYPRHPRTTGAAR